MTLHIRGYHERAATPADPGTPIRFIASTEGVARDGMIIESRAWQLDNFRSNPVVLWNHGYISDIPPIGRADNVHVENGQLVADITFDQSDPFARQIESKYRSGFMHAVSVGWETEEAKPGKGNERARVTRADLLDISTVPVPGDPGALKRAEARALADLGREFLSLTETDDDSKPDALDWQGTSVLMARLFTGAALETSDDDRRRQYDRLARRYERHGQVAPEFLPAAHLAGLGEPELRGLFFAGEPDTYPDLFADGTRAGAVLSKRNHDDLTTAADLITGVIARAAKEAEQADPPVDMQRAAEPDVTALAALRRALGAKDE